MPTFSRSLEQSLHRALALANERHHEYATLEHLLLALIDDQDAAAVMRACNVDLEKLRRSHAAYLLQEQDMTRYDAVNYISHGIAKRPGMSESRPVRGVEDETDTKGGDEPKKKGDALDAYCINLN